MTPFDPDALVAMLLAFYPAVSAAAFARARGERPEYFAGGVIIGSKGDKLQLPDGRIFDCIFAAGGPPSGQRWQAIDVTNDPGSGDPGLVLVAGPLAPIDTTAPIFDPSPVSFESLVGDHLGALDGADGVLDGAGQTVVAFDGAAALDDSFRRLIDPAQEAHDGIRSALDADDPIDEVGAAHDLGGVPDTERQQYEEAPPPDVPVEDPGNPPDDDGGHPNPPPPI